MHEKCWALSGSNLFDTQMVFLIEWFEKVDSDRNMQMTKKKHEKFPRRQSVSKIYQPNSCTYSYKHRVFTILISRSIQWCNSMINTGITHVFSRINFYPVPRKLFEQEAVRPSVQTSSKGPGKC